MAFGLTHGEHCYTWRAGAFWHRCWLLEVVPKPECVACAVARLHGGSISCSTMCAQFVGCPWFCDGPRVFRCIFMSNWMCTNHWIFVVLQWPALILWHVHVQSYECNSLDFLCFTVARRHFAALSWPQRAEQFVRDARVRACARVVDNFNACAWACDNFCGVQRFCTNAQ